MLATTEIIKKLGLPLTLISICFANKTYYMSSREIMFETICIYVPFYFSKVGIDESTRIVVAFI